MINLWTFGLQSLSVTLTALILLIVKRIFQDKLSPRWQYGAWSILVLGLFVPVSSHRYFFLPIPLWIEQLKTVIERSLNSSFTSVYEPVKVLFPFPVLLTSPKSITDYLFVLYVLGVLFFFIQYVLSYLKLKSLLRQGTSVSLNIENQIKDISRQLNVKPCKVLVLDGIQSAFITGLIHPVLVLPNSDSISDKILLHELMHLKYHDALQNTFWCLMRCLHWCNPFMHSIFHLISNDMESLCDQRVLELLQGEELREYGLILLNMANDKYACAIGTSSISNGGKNISQRIEAIARFKKYPKGMALVSICILLLLSNTILQGNAYEVSYNTYTPSKGFKFEQAMALTRLHRPTTLAGAVDTYAKSLILENGFYLASVSPLDQQETIQNEMITKGYYSQIEVSPLLQELSNKTYYNLHNLKLVTKNTYSASLLIGDRYDSDENTQYFRQDILITKDEGYIVQPIGNPELFSGGLRDIETRMDENLGEIQKLKMTGNYGTVTIRIQSSYEVDNTASTNNPLPFMSSYQFDNELKLNAEFDHIWSWTITDYDYSSIANENSPKKYVEIQTAMVRKKDETPEYMTLGSSAYSSGSSSSGKTSIRSNIEHIENYHLRSAGGSGHDSSDLFPFEEYAGFYVRIIWDGEIVEELFLDGGAQ